MTESSESEPPPEGRRKAASRDRGSLVSAVAAVLAIVAMGLSGWALQRTFSGASASAPEYSDAERTAAKGNICADYETVWAGVSRNSSTEVPGGEADDAGTLAAAANERIALYDGGQYLLDRLDPAAPRELADAVRRFANLLMDVGAAVTAGALDTDPVQAARIRDAEVANTKVGQLCA